MPAQQYDAPLVWPPVDSVVVDSRDILDDAVDGGTAPPTDMADDLDAYHPQSAVFINTQPQNFGGVPVVHADMTAHSLGDAHYHVIYAHQPQRKPISYLPYVGIGSAVVLRGATGASYAVLGLVTAAKHFPANAEAVAALRAAGVPEVSDALLGIPPAARPRSFSMLTLQGCGA
jgi:hypothetical protein